MDILMDDEHQYYLVNDTTKEYASLCNFVKLDDVLNNEAVHYAFIHYIYHNEACLVRLLSDEYFFGLGYKEIDLMRYTWYQNEAQTLAGKLNKLEGYEKYECFHNFIVEKPIKRSIT
jgi:hypothetical protein